MRPDRSTQFTGGNNTATSTTKHRCHRTYGLTPSEFAAEARRLLAAGWQGWELNKAFDCRPCTEQWKAAA